MKAKGKLLIALLCVLIVSIAWSPAVLATPTAGGTIASPVVAADIAPLQAGNKTIQEIAADPVVQAAIEAAWADSNAGNHTTRHEEGGWIYECMKDEHIIYVVVRWPSGNRSSITPSPIAPPPGCRLVGEFHTHPNPPVDEDGKRWDQGPSVQDRRTKPAGITGAIIRNAAGLVFY